MGFNPFQGALLLSGSQDATIRLWDVRELAGDRSVMTCQSLLKYPGNNEGIRDLRWSPTNGVEFAVGTDNGVIQHWDFRRASAPLLKVNAHEKTCHSIDWHPDGKHIASGGADKNVKIWDFSSTDRRMKACWQLRAPHAVLQVRWRPTCWLADSQNAGNWQCTQLATSYDHQDPRIHIWDFCRPFMPLREIERHDTAPTEMLWHSDNLLWSVGISGMFTQTDMHFVPKVLDRRSLNTVAIAPSGQINLFSENRARRQRSLGDASTELLQRSHRQEYNGERFSGSPSATDGSLEEPSLLSSSFHNRRRKSASSRSIKSIASTPPSAGINAPVLRLDEALDKAGVYQSAQMAAYGSIPGTFDESAFEFLARYYTSSPETLDIGVESNSDHIIGDGFRENAVLATYTGQHRLAQSWRILGLAIEKELKARAEQRIQCQTSSVLHSPDPKSSSIAQKDWEDRSNENSTKILDQDSVPKSLTPLVLETSSNVTTPVARPVQHVSNDFDLPGKLAILNTDASLLLPGPAWGRRAVSTKQEETRSEINAPSRLLDHLIKEEREVLTPIKIPRESIDSNEHDLYQYGKQNPSSSPVRSFTDIDHGMNERRAAMENYKAKPRPILRLDEPFSIPGKSSSVPRFDRHDSNESFQMFSASTDSSHRATSMAGSFGSNHGSNKSGSTPDPWDSNTRREYLNGQISGENPSLSSPKKSFLSPKSSLRESSLEKIQEQSFADNFENSPFPEARLTPPLHVKNLESPVIHISTLKPLDRPETPLVDFRSSTANYFKPCDFDPLQSHSSSLISPLPPWTATKMLPQLLEYHTTQLSDTQQPAHLLLHLQSLLDPHSTMIPTPYAESILHDYHSQLTSLSLHTQAAALRNFAYPNYPDIYDHGTYGIQSGGAWCTTCLKPSKGSCQRWCERCKQSWGDCPICNGEGPISSLRSPCAVDKFIGREPKNPCAGDALWGWCQGCGHGGHVGCLRVWWSDALTSEGGCATQGCLHDCVIGIRREERIRELEEGKKGKSKSVVRDGWVVGESRAVERARGLVVGTMTTTGGQGQTSAKGLRGSKGGALSAGIGNGGKRVRLLVPEEEMEGERSGVVEGEGASKSAP